MKQYFSILPLILTASLVIAQGSKTPPPVVYEKVYLHTDRELYSPGDTLWFKSYLVSGISHKLLPGFKNIYVQLVSPTGEVISNRLLLSVYGESHGDIALSDSLPEGQYTLRAWTKYLENFGEGSYFHKRIRVNKPKSSLELDLQEGEAPKEIEAMFFPEGGNLALNTTNYIAFKVISTDGRGIDASGAITSQQGDTITRFSTRFLGMGRFTLMPKKGVRYYATIDGYPGSKQELGHILEGGYALHFKDEIRDVLFTVSRDITQTQPDTVYLQATHKGVSLFREEVAVENFTGAIKISKSRFPQGITKITLSDSHTKILAERLVFIDANYGNTVKVEADKEEYQTREKVSLDIEPLLASNDSVNSTLSVSVVREDYLVAAGNSQNIKSYLLLDSELKGAIELPALYFFDEKEITAAEKLDLLMMVQGWRSYYWDEIIMKMLERLPDWDDAGLTISGRVKRLFRDKNVVGGKVTLTSFSPRLVAEETTTDSLGRFRFTRMVLLDSAEVMVTALNEKGKKRVELTTDSMGSYAKWVDTTLLNQAVCKIGIPMKYYREIYLQQMAERTFNPEAGSIYIGEVAVVANRIDNFEQVDSYKPFAYLVDDTYLITKADYKYGTIYNFLEQKAGLTDVGKFVTTIYGNNISLIQYWLDGEWVVGINNEHYIDETLNMLSTPIQEIYQIDIQKSPPMYSGKFIFIYKKKFSNLDNKGSYNENQSIFSVNGFQQPHKFYSPKYTLENIKKEIPDFRPTLYWSPEVVVSGGKANIDFFTCDKLSRYVIIVEGISKNGKVCYGTGRFSVTDFNPAIRQSGN